MRLEVPYGGGTTSFEIDERRVDGVVTPNTVEIGDEAATLRRALGNPIDSPPLGEFLADDDVLVIVNDTTRPTPTAAVLEEIAPALDARADVRFIVATGTHRDPTGEEIGEIFGRFRDVYADRIEIHDCRNAANLVNVGTTSRGTRVAVNRRAIDASRIVAIGSVEPHFFAGYTGGRKSFLPGLSAFDTVERNHSHACSPLAQPRALEGNPVHEDMTEALGFLKRLNVFAVTTVVDLDRRVYAAAAGDLEQSFFAAVPKADDIYSVDIAGRSPIVVAVAPPPLDINLYQTQKAIEHAKLAVEDGGILILVAQCAEGLGQETFVRILTDADTFDDALSLVAGRYRFGYHKVVRLVGIMRRMEIWAVTDLAPEVIRGIFMRPFTSLQSAVDEALARRGDDDGVLILPAASVTVPRLPEAI